MLFQVSRREHFISCIKIALPKGQIYRLISSNFSFLIFPSFHALRTHDKYTEKEDKLLLEL